MLVEASEYIVRYRKQETPTITTLSLSRIDGTIPRYHSGQYLTIYFPDLSQTIGKEYSISSAPSEHLCTLTVKAIGKFSNRLCSLSVGNTVLASGPYGVFYPKHCNSSICLIAGGIGITPFRSIVYETLVKTPAAPIKLLYSGQTIEDMPFGDELCTLAKQNRFFSIERFITRACTPLSKEMNYRRIQVGDITAVRDSRQTEFLISGPLSFVLELQQMLLIGGVPYKNVLTEACDTVG